MASISGDTLEGDRYTTPQGPFGMTPDKDVALADTVQQVRSARDIPFQRCFLSRVGPLMTLLEFDG